MFEKITTPYHTGSENARSRIAQRERKRGMMEDRFAGTMDGKIGDTLLQTALHGDLLRLLCALVSSSCQGEIFIQMRSV